MMDQNNENYIMVNLFNANSFTQCHGCPFYAKKLDQNVKKLTAFSYFSVTYNYELSILEGVILMFLVDWGCSIVPLQVQDIPWMWGSHLLVRGLGRETWWPGEHGLSSRLYAGWFM